MTFPAHALLGRGFRIHFARRFLSRDHFADLVRLFFIELSPDAEESLPPLKALLFCERLQPRCAIDALAKPVAKRLEWREACPVGRNAALDLVAKPEEEAGHFSTQPPRT